MAYGVNAPLGLVANSTYGSSPWAGSIWPYQIPTAYTTSLFQGDLLTMANGQLNIFTPNTLANSAIGVFHGCRYTDTNGIVQFSKYWPANTVVLAGTIPIANIITDSNTVFSLQCNAAVTPTTANAINKNVNVSFATPGNTSTGQSGMMLDTSSWAVTANLPLHIIGFDPIPGNVSGTPYANLLVKLNNTSTNAGATGV